MYSFDRNKVISILLRNKIDKMLGLRSCDLPHFCDAIIYDYNYKNLEVFNNSKFSRSSNLLLLLIYYVLGAFISKIRYFKYRKYQHINAKKNKYICLPFSDKYVRFKYVPEIITNNCLILYMPIFHYDNIVSHIDAFKKSKSDFSFITFKWDEVFTFIIKVLLNYKSIKKTAHEFNNEFKCPADRVNTAILISLLYSLSIKNVVKKNKFDQKTIWLFDYDLDYKYIIYNSQIKSKLNKSHTIHIQHGMFWGNNLSYTNPVADKTFCCSKREKKEIDKIVQGKALVLGAPLQSFEKDKIITKIKYKIDCLLLLTNTNLNEINEIQKSLLIAIDKTNINYKLRLRPASYDIDIKHLNIKDHNRISTIKSLKEDISRSRVVVSLSGDALYECFRQNKSTVWLMAKTDYDQLHLLQTSDNDDMLNINYSIATTISFVEHNLSKIVSSDIMHSKTLIDNFGEMDFERYRQIFLENLSTIESSLE